jgi:PEGA domain
MDPALAPAAAAATVTFHDGLGERHRILDRARNEPVEILCLRSELTAVPSFEFSLRERVSHLSTFRHACYARVRSVERLKNSASTLALVSDVTPGTRLSEILAFAEKSEVTLDIDAALCLLRQLVPAVAMLHENASEIAHGAIAAERIIVTPGARIIVVEHVMGSAIAELKYSSDQYWKELRIAVPGSAQPRFDHRSDVSQIAVVALSLILGRPMLDDETPGRLGDVVASSWANSARGGLEPLPAGLRAWLVRALQLDPRNLFDSAVDAQEELERVLGESDYLAAPATLEAFLAEYRAANEPVASASVAAAPVPEPLPAVVAQPMPSPLAHEASDLRRSLSNHEERDGVRPADRAAEAMRHIETPPRHVDTAAAPTPVVHTYPPPVAQAYPPPVASASSEPWRIGATRDERDNARLADRMFDNAKHTESPAAPSPVVQAYRPSDRSAATVDLEMTPLAQSFPSSPAPASSGVRRAAPKSEERDTLASRNADGAEPAKDYHAAPSARREISFSDVHDTPLETEDDVKPATARKRWPFIAAAAVIALAAVGVPAARRYLAPAAAVATDGTLIVTTSPPGAQLFIDGVERGITPLTLAVKPGAHSLELRGNGAPRLMPITVVAGAQVSQYIELPTSASTFGQLRIRTEPAGARISVDGVARGISPVTVADLPPGEHAVVLESDLGSIKQTVTVEAGNTASLMVPLAAPDGAPVSGWMAISAPAVVQLFEGGRLLGTSQSDRLMVSAGRHDIEIVSEAIGYRVTRTVQVSPGKVTPIKIEFPKGTIALNATPWAEVWVDGEKIGDTPIGNYTVTLGSHDIVFRNPDLGEQRHTVIVTLKTPARLSVDLRKK